MSNNGGINSREYFAWVTVWSSLEWRPFLPMKRCRITKLTSLVSMRQDLGRLEVHLDSQMHFHAFEDSFFSDVGWVMWPGTISFVVQSTLSKRTANLVPAELHLYLCNWTLSTADTSWLSRTADTFFKCWFENLWRRTQEVCTNL